MEDTERRFEIHSLRGEIEVARLLSGSIASKFEHAPTMTEKVRIARTYDEVLKELHAMQYLLCMWQRRERESA
jgi:hypothetical protein